MIAINIYVNTVDEFKRVESEIFSKNYNKENKPDIGINLRVHELDTDYQYQLEEPFENYFAFVRV